MSNTNSTVKEVVLYKVKKDHLTDYPKAVIPELLAFLQSQKGFISHECLMATEHQGHLVDLVSWENMDAAKASAAEWQRRTKSGEFSTMIAAIEKVDFFDHLTTIS